MAVVTRSLHPLPFEHLEPRRFESLVRQIAYDFQVWRALEALGEAGSDGGFDARGYELIGANIQSPDSILESEERDEPPSHEERIWLIQCKRESAIGPSKLLQHLDAILAQSLDGLYGDHFCRILQIFQGDERRVQDVVP